MKSLLLEAQKGPESLQEALKVQAGNHRSQQNELRALIDTFKVALSDASAQRDIVLQDQRSGNPTSSSVPLSALKELRLSSQKTNSLLESVPPQLGQLKLGLGRVEGELSAVRKLLETKPQAEPLASQPHVAAEVRPEGGEQWEREAVVRVLGETQRTLSERIRSSTLYNAVFSYTATVITISAVYLLLRGTG